MFKQRKNFLQHSLFTKHWSHLPVSIPNLYAKIMHAIKNLINTVSVFNLPLSLLATTK